MARATPRLLLLDEPARGVDIGAREEIFAILNDLVSRGMAIFMASSDLAEVRRLAHRVDSPPVKLAFLDNLDATFERRARRKPFGT